MSQLAQRGGLFGLDARITLLIYLGLSALVGWVVYQVYVEITATRMVAFFNSYRVAYQAYVQDVGSPPASLNLLYADTAPRWQGPYLDYTGNGVIATTCWQDTRFGAQQCFHQGADTAWDGSSIAPCTATNCWVWLGHVASVSKAKFTELNLRYVLDEKIDGQVDLNSGTFRSFGGNLYYRLAATTP